MKLSTKKRDAEILKRWKKGGIPKKIAFDMGLSSVWVVYHAMKRGRRDE
jgi:FixJ family two-component response regulator